MRYDIEESMLRPSALALMQAKQYLTQALDRRGLLQGLAQRRTHLERDKNDKTSHYFTRRGQSLSEQEALEH